MTCVSLWANSAKKRLWSQSQLYKRYFRQITRLPIGTTLRHTWRMVSSCRTSSRRRIFAFQDRDAPCNLYSFDFIYTIRLWCASRNSNYLLLHAAAYVYDIYHIGGAIVFNSPARCCCCCWRIVRVAVAAAALYIFAARARVKWIEPRAKNRLDIRREL